MAFKEKPTRDPINDFGWLTLFLIVIGVIWFAQGGPVRLTSISPLLKIAEFKPAPPSSGEKSGISQTNNNNQIAPEQIAPPIPATESPYKEKISLNAYHAKESDPQKEYIEIKTISKTEPILITGWTLKGKEGLDIIIGQGAYLPYSSQTNQQNQIYLEPNATAIITTGQSPIGTSFRLNICTGYFNQFQKFFPSLTEECPVVPADSVPLSYPAACFNFVKSLSRCRMPANIPYETAIEIGNDCILFLKEKSNYSGCVNSHKDEENFYKKEWRIYLGRNKELWNNQRDKITLRDQQGKIIDEVSY